MSQKRPFGPFWPVISETGWTSRKKYHLESGLNHRDEAKSAASYIKSFVKATNFFCFVGCGDVTRVAQQLRLDALERDVHPPAAPLEARAEDGREAARAESRAEREVALGLEAQLHRHADEGARCAAAATTAAPPPPPPPPPACAVAPPSEVSFLSTAFILPRGATAPGKNSLVKFVSSSPSKLAYSSAIAPSISSSRNFLHTDSFTPASFNVR